MTPQRRRWLALHGAGAWALAGLGAAPLAAAVSGPQRIVSIDWTAAETLLGLGVTPLAMCEQAAYRRWVVDPPLPDGVRELGLRIEPNLELLQQLRPDLILVTPQFDAAIPRLQRLAPITRLTLFDPLLDPYDVGVAMARTLTARTGRGDADALQQRTDEALAATRAAVSSHAGREFLIVQFVDHRLLRVFDVRSLYHAALTRMGLHNAWKGPGTTWGFSNVGMDHLARHPDAVLLCVQPLPPGVEVSLSRSRLWQALPFVRARRTVTLPPVWSFGGLMSIQRFARLLTAALAGRPSL